MIPLSSSSSWEGGKRKKTLWHQKLPRNCRSAKFHQKIRWRIIGACSYCTKQISPKPAGKKIKQKQAKQTLIDQEIFKVSKQKKWRDSATIAQELFSTDTFISAPGAGVHLLVHFSFLNRLQGDCLVLILIDCLNCAWVGKEIMLLGNDDHELFFKSRELNTVLKPNMILCGFCYASVFKVLTHSVKFLIRDLN